LHMSFELRAMSTTPDCSVLVARSSLLFLLFFRQRRIYFQQAFGQIHLNALVLKIDPLQEYLSIWNFMLMLFRSHHQQRRFTRAEANIADYTNFTSAIEQRATDQIAYVERAGFQLCALPGWKLQLAADQNLCIRNRINARDLQHQPVLVRPNVVDLQLAPAAVFRQRLNLQARVQPSRNIGVDLGGNFAVAALRFDYDG
jgi:hypothetical protein